MTWTLPDYVIAAFIAVLFVWGIVHSIRQCKQGKCCSGCCGDCSQCKPKQPPQN